MDRSFCGKGTSLICVIVVRENCFLLFIIAFYSLFTSDCLIKSRSLLSFLLGSLFQPFPSCLLACFNTFEAWIRMKKVHTSSPMLYSTKILSRKLGFRESGTYSRFSFKMGMFDCRNDGFDIAWLLLLWRGNDRVDSQLRFQNWIACFVVLSFCQVDECR